MGSIAAGLCAAVALCLSTVAAAQTPGQTLQTVRARGFLRCGIDRSEAEYSSTDEHGNRAAFDRDLCKAVAIAALGAQARMLVTYYADDATSMAALAAGKADLIASLSVRSEPSDAEGKALPVAFSQPVLRDAVGLMVRSDAGVTAAYQLSGRKICYLTETPTEAKLQAWFTEHHLDLLPFPFQEEGEMEAAFVTENCVAIAGDLTRLALTRASTGAMANAYFILQQTYGADTLAMAYRTDDPEWAQVVEATLNVLYAAERNQAKALAQQTANTAHAFSLPDSWATDVIAAVGSYGDIFDRTLGKGSLLKLDRATFQPAQAAVDPRP